MFAMVRTIALGMFAVILVVMLWESLQSFSYLDEDACVLGGVRMKGIYSEIADDGAISHYVNSDGSPAPFNITSSDPDGDKAANKVFDVLDADGHEVRADLPWCTVAVASAGIYGTETGVVVRVNASGAILATDASVDVLDDDGDSTTPIELTEAQHELVPEWKPAVALLEDGIIGGLFDSLRPFYLVLMTVGMAALVWSEWPEGISLRGLLRD